MTNQFVTYFWIVTKDFVMSRAVRVKKSPPDDSRCTQAVMFQPFVALTVYRVPGVPGRPSLCPVKSSFYSLRPIKRRRITIGY